MSVNEAVEKKPSLQQEDFDSTTELGEDGNVESEQHAEEEEKNKEDEEEEEDGDADEDIDISPSDSIGISYEKHEKDLKEKLRKIEIKSTQLEEEKEPFFDPEKFPPSYQSNSRKELQALTICKRFISHYNHLYDRRQSIFLKPLNEFGVKKLVCTSINPTQLPYKDLLDWPDIASFVATHLTYSKLKSPTDLPKTLYAPQTVLDRQRGHCFEFSTVLCSMLIGSGYDAFVVSGYATREVATLDCSYTRCPLVEEDKVVYPDPITLNIKKYTVRPPRSNRSEYLLRMKMKRNAEAQAAKDRLNNIREMQREMDEAPPEDELQGWRVHSWVLVLAGHRDIKKCFFIEPTRGVAVPLDWEGYLGLETLWNHLNYYINVQQNQPNSMKDLKFDIGDSRDWEYIFSGQDLHLNKTESEIEFDRRTLYIEGDLCQNEMHFDLPPSWCLPLSISRERYDLRYPTGMTMRRYKRSLVEFFAPYLHPEGLVRKLYVYSDLECQVLFYTQEYYAHRSEKLHQRFTHHPSGKVIEYFLDGREDFIKEHHYYAHTPGPETDRTLEFYKNQRTDALYRREESPSFMKEWYEIRPDRKRYRETQFGPSGCKYEHFLWPEARPIVSLVEEFHRNPAVPADTDIMRVTFSVAKDGIDVEYHVDDDRLFGSTRHFNKPERWWDENFYLDWKPELHWEFQANPYARPLNELSLFQMMVRLMDMEAKSRADVRKYEKETKRLLQTRTNDVAKLTLIKSFIDADIIPSVRVARLQEKARLKAEYILKKSDILKDFLEPYLHRFGLAKVTNKKQANRITESLMADLKDRLLFMVDTTRSSYESLKDDIRTMQMIFCYKLSQISAEALKEYNDELSLKLFMGHILGQRLITMKEDAPIKYRALYEQIKNDPRMAPYM